MNIPRCVGCNRGIYLSDGISCSCCGMRLQLSINIHELEFQIEVDKLTEKLTIATNTLQAIIPQSETKLQRLVNALSQGAVSFIGNYYR